MFNEQHKKESPILSLLGMGGGIGGGLVQGGSGGGGMDATGGTVYEDTSNNRKIHVFTFPNSDNFVVNSDPGSATLSVLCVGGGGGEGGDGCGGIGAARRRGGAGNTGCWRRVRAHGSSNGAVGRHGRVICG